MKTPDTVETPAAGTATRELFAHEWDEQGHCINPEVLALDGMPKGTTATFRLGMGPDNLWRVMWYVAKGSAAMGHEFVTLDNNPCETRALALQHGISVAADFFTKEKRALKVLAGFGAKVNAEQAKESLPANDLPPVAIPVPEPELVALAAVEPNPFNPRKDFPADYIAELAESLKSEGLLQRIGVKLLAPSPTAEGVEGLAGISAAPVYRLLYGECRWRAAKSLAWTTIRAEVYPADLDTRAERKIIQVENLKRRNLNPIEEANGYADLMRDFGMTQEQCAQAVGKSRPVVANALRLLDLPESVREHLAAGALTMAHGTALARFKAWPMACARIAAIAIKEGSSASDLEKHLPFGEQLVEAKLAIDLFDDTGLRYTQSWSKKLVGLAGAFFWEDRNYYECYAYCLDMEAGAAFVAALKQKKQEEEAERENERSGRNESGELTPAAKKARQKKIDDNAKNRLETAALGDFAFRRLVSVKSVDAEALAVVCAEALGQCGAIDVDDLAKGLSIKLPKGFKEYDPAKVLELDTVDMIRLAAAALSARGTEESMRYAHVPHEDVEVLTKAKDGSAAKLVDEWKAFVKAGVEAGDKPADLVARGCPEFIAVNLTRIVKREAREVNSGPSSASLTAKATQKPAKGKAKK
jgi:ParB/RepB/Spo0J family partition protein